MTATESDPRPPPFVTVAAACLAVLVPILAAPALPFYDLPNHLARLYVLGGDAASPIRQSYAPTWSLMPDLGVDLVYWCVHAVAAPETVIRLCIAGSILLLTAAVCRMQQVLWGRFGHLAALSPVLLTGLCVYMGYVNYTLSVAVAFTGLALYLGWRPRLSPARVAALSGIATLAWLSHIAGFAVFAVLLATLDATWQPPAAVSQGRVARAARSLRLVAVVFGPGLVLSLLAERQLPVTVVSYEGIGKARMLLSPLLLTGGRSDLLLWFAAVAALVLAACTGAVQVARALRPALTVFVLLIAVCPWRVGSAIDVDARMVMPLTALALAGARFRPSLGKGPRVACGAVLLALVLVRGADLLRSGRIEAEETTTFRRLVGQLAERSAILTVRADGGTCGPGDISTFPAITHLAAYASVDRGAYTPLLFTAPGMQPLRALRPGFPARAVPELPPTVEVLHRVTQAGSAAALLAADRAAPEPDPKLASLHETGGMPFLGDGLAAYQAVLVLDDGCGSNPLPVTLTLLGSGRFFSLFRVRAS